MNNEEILQKINVKVDEMNQDIKVKIYELVKNMRSDMAELKEDIRDLKTDVKELSKSINQIISSDLHILKKDIHNIPPLDTLLNPVTPENKHNETGLNKHDKAQAWFWTDEWQKGEEEAEDDILNERVKQFGTVKELISDLHNNDD